MLPPCPLRRAASVAAAAVVGLGLALAAPAAAQPAAAPRYAEEPTTGIQLPATRLAGEHDALAVAANPGGLVLLRGANLGVLYELGREAGATGAGAGVGVYLASVLGGGLAPRVGFGFGVESLTPPRVAVAPDPGTPVRLSTALSFPLGPAAGIGWAWRHYFDDAGKTLAGVDTFDAGLSMRLGARLAAGLVVRDLFAPTVALVPVQRRYELELVTRPAATDRLELALGGRIGEVRHDVDGWLKASLRVTAGLYLVGEAESASLHELPRGADAGDAIDRREVRILGGFEVSLGRLGAGAFSASAIDDAGGRLAGAGGYVRWSADAVPSLLGPRHRIQRIDLTGSLDSRGVVAVVTQLRALRDDPAVVALFVEVDGLEVGWATAQELRAELAGVRAAGKKVFAYLVAGNTRDYFVASAATRIWVDPAGGLRLAGFAGTSLYFKGLFDLLGVTAQFEKIEEYKSAPEAYTQQGPSEPAARMRDELYDDIYAAVLGGIAEARGIGADEVRALVDAGPYTAGDLGSMPKLVDAVADPDQMVGLLAKELGDYYPVDRGQPLERPARWASPAVAVVVIDGDIVDGKSQTIPGVGTRLVGGDTISQAIAWARASRDVEAIVLRIDSPGGSALASELISREVFKTRGVKPILCSMGDVAASGGYFAASGCDLIFAQPTTITGSIGIFTGKFDLSALLGRLGLTWVTSKRGQNADMESYFRPYTDEERVFIKSKLRYYYGRFVGAVAQGRNMKEAEVDDVGRGHVWSGTRAAQHRLVDRFGGIGDALAEAKRRAGIPAAVKTRVLLLPREPPSLIARLLGVSGVDEGGALPWLSPAARSLLAGLPGSLWLEPDAPQARLPFTIVWE